MDLFSALYWEDVASDVLRVNCSRERMSCLMTSMIKWKCCANSDGVELGKAEGTMGNRFQIKYDFDKLEKVHSISKMKFSKCKCDVLCLRQKKKRKKKSEQRKVGTGDAVGHRLSLHQPCWWGGGRKGRHFNKNTY